MPSIALKPNKLSEILARKKQAKNPSSNVVSHNAAYKKEVKKITEQVNQDLNLRYGKVGMIPTHSEYEQGKALDWYNEAHNQLKTKKNTADDDDIDSGIVNTESDYAWSFHYLQDEQAIENKSNIAVSSLTKKWIEEENDALKAICCESNKWAAFIEQLDLSPYLKERLYHSTIIQRVVDSNNVVNLCFGVDKPFYESFYTAKKEDEIQQRQHLIDELQKHSNKKVTIKLEALTETSEHFSKIPAQQIECLKIAKQNEFEQSIHQDKGFQLLQEEFGAEIAVVIETQHDSNFYKGQMLHKRTRITETKIVQESELESVLNEIKLNKQSLVNLEVTHHKNIHIRG